MHLNVLLIPVYTIFSDRSLTAGWISKDVVGRIVYSALSDCDNLMKSQKCSDLRNTGSSNFSECPHGTFVVALFSSFEPNLKSEQSNRSSCGSSNRFGHDSKISPICRQ